MNKFSLFRHNTSNYKRLLFCKPPFSQKWYEPPLWRFKKFSRQALGLLRKEKPLLWRGRKDQLKSEETDVRQTPALAGRFLFPYYIPPFRFWFAKMACGATLKRSMEFEALLSPQSPKRRRCNPLTGSPSTPSPQRYNLRPPLDSPTHSMSPLGTGGEHRLTPGTYRERRLQ